MQRVMDGSLRRQHERGYGQPHHRCRSPERNGMAQPLRHRSGKPGGKGSEGKFYKHCLRRSGAARVRIGAKKRMPRRIGEKSAAFQFQSRASLTGCRGMVPSASESESAGAFGIVRVQVHATVTAMRVAFFPDSFHEVNGVAHTARNFVAYAQRHDLPFLCVRAAQPGVRGRPKLETAGHLWALDLPRSRASIPMEKDLSFDPAFARYLRTVEGTLRSFRPDVIHITGPSELGILGAYFAWRLGVPLAASWHTNVHEYAAWRAAWLGRLIPASARWIEAAALSATARFYRLARVIYAPNEELCDLLRRKTGRACHVMQRGVDAALFSPAKRTRTGGDDTIVLGYVGRLSVEKNVALLPRIEHALQAAGVANACFLIVGHGDEEARLRQQLQGAYFMGVQRGEALAQSYADMDLFVFPSETDTFGNVVLEAMASGVPCAVTIGGGPKFIVEDGVTGIVRPAGELPAVICDLVRDEAGLRTMGRAAREYALTCQWDTIFDDVHANYPTPPGAPPSRS